MTWVHSAGMAKLARLKGLHGPGQSVEADNEVPPLVNQMGGSIVRRYPQSWMNYFVENPNQKWMIWGISILGNLQMGRQGQRPRQINLESLFSLVPNDMQVYIPD